MPETSTSDERQADTEKEHFELNIIPDSDDGFSCAIGPNWNFAKVTAGEADAE